MATTTGAPAPSTAAVDPTQRRFRGCAKLEEYEVTDKLGEGTFGVVSKGRSRRTGAIVALKKIIIHNEKDGFPITALREIKLLKMLSHVNILKLDEMAVERHKGTAVWSCFGEKARRADEERCRRRQEESYVVHGYAVHGP